MKSTIIGLLYCFLLSIGMLAQAQDFQKDILRMKSSLLAIDSYRSTIKTTVYRDGEMNQPPEEHTTEILQSGRYSFSKSKEMDILLNDQYILVDDKLHGMLTVQKHSLTTAPLSRIGLEEIENIKAMAASIVYKGITKNTKCYVIKPSAGPVELLELYLNTETGLPQKEVRHYRQAIELGLSRSVMEYRFSDIGKTFSNQQFSEHRYVKISTSGEVSLKPNYQNYQLVVGGGLKATHLK